MLDQYKARANDMHLSLNADRFPDVTEGLPIWMRTCQRTDPLAHVLEGLRAVKGIEKSLLIITIDRDRMENVIRALLAVDFMQVCIHIHIFIHVSVRDRKGNINKSFLAYEFTQVCIHVCMLVCTPNTRYKTEHTRRNGTHVYTCVCMCTQHMLQKNIGVYVCMYTQHTL
jgi:hypothetical protein